MEVIPVFVITEVAAAPDPYTPWPPGAVFAILVIVTVGGTVYPNPGFDIRILSIEWTPFLTVVIATASAVDPGRSAGEVPIVTVGTWVYPAPSSVRTIFCRIPVLPKLSILQVAVTPWPTRVSSVIYPISLISSSITSILVSMSSPSYWKSSHSNLYV